MKLKTVMQAIAVAVDARAEDLPLADVHEEVAKELMNLLEEEEKYLLQQCISAEAADIMYN
jgi:hypothetical protein